MGGDGVTPHGLSRQRHEYGFWEALGKTGLGLRTALENISGSISMYMPRFKWGRADVVQEGDSRVCV